MEEKSKGNSDSEVASKSGSLPSLNSASGLKGDYEITGEVRIALRHQSGQLLIYVDRARALAAADRNGLSDPYVKTYLLPDKTEHSKRKTKIKKKTLNPVYEETLKYDTEECNFPSCTLWLSVWDWDRFGRNRFLGELRFPLSEVDFSVSSSEQWYALQEKEPDRRKELVSLTAQHFLTVQQVASELSYKEAEALSKVLCGLSQATQILSETEPHPSVMTTLRMDVSTGSSEATFLDTFSMNMCYGPLVFNDNNSMTNLSTMWILTSASSGSEFYLSNYVTHTSWARLTESDGSWLNVTLTEFESSPPPQIFTRGQVGRDGKFALLAEYDNQTYYLVAITAVRRQGRNTSRQIVASLRENLNPRRNDSVAIWSQSVDTAGNLQC